MPQAARRTKQEWLAQRLDEDLRRFGDVRKSMAAIAMADASVKYELLMSVARHGGHADWTCPALHRMIAPVEPAAP